MALFGGQRRRLERATGRVRAAFAGPGAAAPVGKALDRAVRDYGAALRLALEADPLVAAALFRDFDGQIPADRYPLAFGGPRDGEWLAALAGREDRRVLTVVFEVATRLGLGDVRHAARDRLAGLLGPERDADQLVWHLRRWRETGVLDRATVERALRAHLAHTALGRDTALWTAFFDVLPEALLPELCEVHCFLGRGRDAVRLADTGARRQQALECCARSPRLADALAGLELARGEADGDAVRRLAGRAAELLVADGEYGRALAHAREAGRGDLASECHERRGDYFDALAACPADQPERLARLVGLCQPEVDRLVERREFAEATRRVTELERAGLDAAEVAALRGAVVTEGRAHFSAWERAGDRREALAAWSRFEEESGQLDQAARRAEEGGDRYRAHRLYRRAGHFGEADRVLTGDETPQARTSRAEARESGGDLLGAAWLYLDAGMPERAVELFMRAGEFTAGADCLLRWRGDEALTDPRLAECLRRAGRVEELVRLCLEQVRRPGVVDQLRALRHDPALPPALAAEAERALEEVDGGSRRPFEERAQAWVAQARAETDRRFAGIWGLDLGTTTCAAAIYDTHTRQVVLCPWKGRSHFASTLSLDREGNELVGLAQEEIFADWLVGHISDSKRAMGTRRVYRVRDRSYRPQEVAARLIRHARGLVEGFLAARVRERVGELAQAELGQVRDDWLTWAEQHHDLRIERPRAVLTIPAYFLNNQKHATRDACEIAGVEAVRLIHEPTAACLSTARERRLTGRVAVVDLGAGTLDASALEVMDNIYDVQRVVGDTHFGGRDFDAVISGALTARLERERIEVPEGGGVARRRLEVAAEYLKIGLSSQEHADYALRAFAGGRDVVLELSRAELAEILDQPLGTLRRTCASFKDSLDEQPDHLVLVGGPMLSPLVRAVVEEVFGLQRTVVTDPRTVVASGAALQAAVIDGRLDETLLLDVTPLPLGIRVVDEDMRESFSALIEANSRIPVERRKDYTTTTENQAAVRIEVFNGQLDAGSQIGQFLLEGIPPAAAGVPQIEVTFSVDENCVLDVTAHDKGTGISKSIQVKDTTLLSPGELDDMTRRYRRQSEVLELRARLRELADEAEASDSEASWRELRQRLSAYRPSSAPAEAGAQRTLGEIFNESGAMEVELLLIQEPLRDMAGKAREYLGRVPGGAGADAATDEDLAEGRHLRAELERLLGGLRPHLDRLASWNALLVRLATAEPDPLRRFRNAHDAGEYPSALAALRQSRTAVTSPEDARRQLRCLAGVGDADAYRDALGAHAGRLGVPLLDPERPEAFRERAGAAFVTVGVGAGGGAVGGGFLVSDRLVVTSRHLLPEGADAARAVRVEAAGVRRPVERIFLPDSRHPDVAVLRLAGPVDAGAATPLRLGHARLVRIGDRVWAPGPPPGALRSAVVNKFELFAEQDLRLFKVGLRLPPPCSGGPLLNDLGEAVGILTIREGAAGGDGVYALTVDALDPLLSDAGFDSV